jgi:hypothetical protein
MAGSEAGTDAPLGWLKEVFSTRPASQIETEFDRIDVIAPKAHKHPFSAGSWRDLPMRQIPVIPTKRRWPTARIHSIAFRRSFSPARGGAVHRGSGATGAATSSLAAS